MVAKKLRLDLLIINAFIYLSIVSPFLVLYVSTFNSLLMPLVAVLNGITSSERYVKGLPDAWYVKAEYRKMLDSIMNMLSGDIEKGWEMNNGIRMETFNDLTLANITNIVSMVRKYKKDYRLKEAKEYLRVKADSIACRAISASPINTDDLDTIMS